MFHAGNHTSVVIEHTRQAVGLITTLSHHYYYKLKLKTILSIMFVY